MAGPKAAAAPAPDHWANYEAVKKEAAALSADRASGRTEASPPGTGGWLGYGDPVEQGMNWAAENLVPAGTPQWARTAGRFIIPQNAPELALAALTLPLGGWGGSATKIGAKVGGKFIPQLLGRGVKQAVKSGIGTGVVGGATGHDPWASGALGAVGGALGQTVGDLGAAALQSKTVGRMVQSAGDKLAEFSGGLFKNIPATASAKDALSKIITGENSKRLNQEILNLGQKYQRNPTRFDPTLDPDIMQWATTATGLARQNAGEIFKTIVDPVTGLKIPWPQLQGIWKYGTPEIRAELVKRGYILTAPGEATTFGVLNKEIKNANLLQHWITGAADPAQITPEMADEVIGRLFTPDMRFTAEGVTELGRRLAIMRPALEQRLGKPAVKELEDALFHEVGQGLQRGVSGQAPGVTLSKTLPFVHPKGGVLPYVPNWEKNAGATLSEGAIKALTPPAAAIAAQAPEKPFERPAPPPPPPSPPAAPPRAVDREAGPASEFTPVPAPAPAGSPWFVPPPPPKPEMPPADWFTSQTTGPAAPEVSMGLRKEGAAPAEPT